MIKVAINGYGRIGRNIVRALYESKQYKDIKIVAINDLSDIGTCAHLTKYDSTHGKFFLDVAIENNDLIINNQSIKFLQERNIENLPWSDLDVDIVMECTGLFTDRSNAQKHIDAGAKKVLISAPSKTADLMVVYGVNEQNITKEHTIISNASCTTNCLAPLVKILNDSFGIESGLMSTVHAYTNDQMLLDVAHQDLHRARSATQSIIPTRTGAAIAIGSVIPELSGKLDGMSFRVPTNNVSVVDLTLVLNKSSTKESINNVLRENVINYKIKNVVQINEEPLVSIDFKHNPHSSIFDLTQTQVINNMVKVVAWYDNEWGFSNRMLDVCKVMMK